MRVFHEPDGSVAATGEHFVYGSLRRGRAAAPPGG
jgi:hypothetical protein